MTDHSRKPPRRARAEALVRAGWSQISSRGSQDWTHPRYGSHHWFTLAAAERAEAKAMIPPTSGRGGIESIGLVTEDGQTIRDSETDGLTLELASGQEIRLSFANLADPDRTRAAVYEQIGHVIPRYDKEQHVEIVRAMLRLCGYVETQLDR
jgi:hypothetical protein